MAFETHTVTGDLRQMFGDAINVASTNGFVETNLANDQTLVYDLDNGVQLLGTGKLVIASDGTWSLTGVPSWDNVEADQNPTHVQIQVVFEYVDPLARRKLVWRSGFLEVDHDGSIGEFVAQQLAPADWRSDFMTEAEALLAQQQEISGLTGEDAAMATIAADDGSAFAGELKATIEDTALDFAGHKIVDFVPGRDLPGVVAHFDPDDLAGATGDSISYWSSAFGTVDLNIAPAVKPTLRAAVENGHNLLRFGTSAYLRDISSIMAAAPSGGWSQPMYFAFVFRAVNVTISTNTLVVGSSAVKLQIAAAGQTIFANAGSDVTVQGAEINDGNLHVVVYTLTTNGWRCYIDGYLVGGTDGSQPQGTGQLVNFYIGPGLGAALGASQFFEYGDVILGSATLSPSKVDWVTQVLAEKYAIADTGRQVNGVSYFDTTDSAGQQVRLWRPQNPNGKVAYWCHPYLATEAISNGVNVYPWIHALIQEGWTVAASRLHTSNWGIDAAQTDLVNLDTLVATALGSVAITDRVLLAGSMGGLAAALAVARGTLANVRGVALSDAVLDLVWAYTGNGNAYQAAINTAYGISAVGSIPSANDPMQLSAGLFTSKKWRFYASTTDTSVTKVNNTDAFRTKIAAAAVKGLVTHNTSGHLNAGAFPPHDLMTFVRSL